MYRSDPAHASNKPFHSGTEFHGAYHVHIQYVYLNMYIYVYLGIIFDNDLRWNLHVINQVGKLRYTSYKFVKLSDYNTDRDFT